jgi:hypothetical protein
MSGGEIPQSKLKLKIKNKGQPCFLFKKIESEIGGEKR